LSLQQEEVEIVKNNVVAKALACGALLMVLAALRPALARAVVVATPVPPYSLSTFAISKNGYSKPDSITFSRSNVFVGYGNGGKPDGSGGATSTIVKYKMDGTVVKTFTVVGHNDGLRFNRETGDLWALQNEDGNSTLVIIEPSSGKQKTFTLGTGPHGGGYDDLVFDGESVFITASAPTLVTNTAPAVVSLKLKGKKVKPTGVINGNASATDVTTGSAVTLNLQDPDSMIRDPFGELVLTSQADGELVIVQHPGRKCQKVFVVPLTSTAGGPTVGNTTADDTVFADAAQGELLVADKNGEKVYAITAPYFAPGAAYTAVVATATPGGSAVAAFVGRTDLTTGFITPIVNGLLNPGGMAFIPAEHDVDLSPVAGGEECP
jgi:hypothetical protein